MKVMLVGKNLTHESKVLTPVIQEVCLIIRIPWNTMGYIFWG